MKVLTGILCICFTSCLVGQTTGGSMSPGEQSLVIGANRLSMYLGELKGRNVGLVVNHSSLVEGPQGPVHLVDTLLRLGIHVRKIFAPEHGFRGDADAGEKIKGGTDKETGLPILSLYGSHKKPLPADLSDLDVLVFDIQDVGARFYTYISTLHYVMEACAENNKTLIVLDRPNPNGFYVDGPVLDTAYRSFVGMHPVPVVHGMTVGEYARMINGEKWLDGGLQCRLMVVPCLNYTHALLYPLKIKPSPNLPNMIAVYLYPSLCFFEGTIVSVGRGTDFPFQVIGHPQYAGRAFSFTPQSREGAKNPPYKGIVCYGIDLRNIKVNYFAQRKSLDLSWLIEFYQKFPDKDNFFNAFFTKLAGTTELEQQIKAGKSEAEIRESWQPQLQEFKAIRKKYLLYEDFE